MVPQRVQTLPRPSLLDPRKSTAPAGAAARYVGPQTLLVVTTVRDLSLCRAVLPERRTGATLGDMQLRSHLLNAGTATRGA
jgi:hypothetical protein